MALRLAAIAASLVLLGTLEAQDAKQVSKTIEGGGASFQGSFWLPSTRPAVRAGAEATTGTSGGLDFARKSQGTWGLMLSLPAGRNNTLRIVYDRVRRGGGVVTPYDTNLFSVGYKAGDYITTDYKFQRGKVSWDFLSYTWPGSKMRFKTLWEVQYAEAEVALNAPLKTTEATDGTDKKWVLLPTFGIGFDQAPSKYFRWEVKGSGFGLPGRSLIWDAEAAVGLRLGYVEILVGGKALQAKTSPKDDCYFNQRTMGPYVGLRWYFDKPE